VRARPLVRALLPVAQPLVAYALRWMASGGLWRGDRQQLRTRNPRHAEGPGLRPAPQPRGLIARRNRLRADAGVNADADTFVVADATAVPVVDLAELLEGHRASSSAVTVVVGADAGGRLRPGGVYVFDRRALAHIPEDGFQDIKEKLIPRLYAAGNRSDAHVPRGRFAVSADIYSRSTTAVCGPPPPGVRTALQLRR
jgi:hypothetical protein